MPKVTPSSLCALFPLPSPPPSPLAPQPVPGATPASGAELVRLLKLNHEKFHCFFNEKGFHNHLSHHLFAAYSFGAPAHILTEAYDLHARDQRPTWTSPEPITASNWTKHLGNPDFYDSYLQFFSDEVLEHGLSETVEKYVFANEANWRGKEEESPLMLARLFGGLLHPAIHLGHGLEFGMPGMAAEGLSMAAVTKPGMKPMMPREFFSDDQFAPKHGDIHLSDLSHDISTLHIIYHTSSSQPAPPPRPSYHGVHSLTLLSRILQDGALAAGQTTAPDSESKFTDTLASRGKDLREYAKLWLVNGEDEQEVEEKLEELAWLATVVFGVGGWREGKKFKADFFTMHMLTSSLFLPSYLPYLSPRSRSLLLRGHLASQLTYYVSRGRPALPISRFLALTPLPRPPNTAAPKPSSRALSKADPFPDPWLPLLQSALFHPEEHLVKAMRALAHYSAGYGGRRRGTFEGVELEGAGGLDGEVFVKVAGCLMQALGWVREGEEKGDWDFDGLGWDHFWEKD